MRHRTKMNRALVRPSRYLLLAVLISWLLPALAVGAERSQATLVQTTTFEPSDGMYHDYFSVSLAMTPDGSTAITGAVGKNATTGAAYIFVRNGGIWSQQAELTASDGIGGNAFGASVAVSRDGGTALVGANADGFSGTLHSGAAYIFVRNGTTWSQQAKLTASDATGGDDFGLGVGISGDGNIAVIGANGKSSDNGAAYVFVRNGTTWQQRTKLTASDAASGDAFGWKVAMSDDGTTAIIGAGGENFGRGAVYVFVNNSTVWTQQAKLTASDGQVNDSLSAYAIALSRDGNTAVIGAAGKYSQIGRPGAAYVFVRNGIAWSQQAELTASDAGSGEDYFGYGVAVSGDGNTAVIGAPIRGVATGVTYVFARSGGAWTQRQQLTTDGGQQGLFGAATAANSDGTLILVGEYGHNIVHVYSAQPATLSRIAVQGVSGSVQVKVGQSVPFTATGTYSDGSTADLTGQVQWSSTAQTVAKVDAGGVVTGEAPGNATITATLGGMSGSVAVTVAPPTPLGVQPAPAPPGRSASPSPGGPTPAPAPIPARR